MTIWSGEPALALRRKRQPPATYRDDTMASKKTSMFTLTERLTINAATTDAQATIDLGSYVDVGDRQALQVHGVDFIFQGTTANNGAGTALPDDNVAIVQVTDLNRAALVFADDRALVASAQLQRSADGQFDHRADQYPDNFGKGSEDGRYVVNDQLYITGRMSALTSGQSMNVTVRVNCSIVTLSAKDFMAIAIQSTAADN